MYSVVFDFDGIIIIRAVFVSQEEAYSYARERNEGKKEATYFVKKLSHAVLFTAYCEINKEYGDKQ